MVYQPEWRIGTLCSGTMTHSILSSWIVTNLFFTPGYGSSSWAVTNSFLVYPVVWHSDLKVWREEMLQMGPNVLRHI